MRDTGWYKSSRSAAASDNCVEVRITGRGVGVRDSKNPVGPTFAFTSAQWRTFVAEARASRLDLS
jgi:Domain of unknown function (DUF397)